MQKQASTSLLAQQQSLNTSFEYGDLKDFFIVFSEIYKRLPNIYIENYTNSNLQFLNLVRCNLVTLDQYPDIILDLDTNNNFITKAKEPKYKEALYFTSFIVDINLKKSLSIPDKIGLDIYSKLNENKIVAITQWIDTLKDHDYIGMILLNAHSRILHDNELFIHYINNIKPYKEYYKNAK